MNPPQRSRPRRLLLKSPAKLNLFLRVLGRRPDGYHNLETIFERVSLCDDVTLSLLPRKIALKTRSKGVPKGPRNLAWRAAKLLKDRFRVREGVRIALKKNIPVAAGLGGGSSNAATALLGLNKLWKLGLPKKRLLALGAELGSDVPFFVLGTRFALGRGRGEKLRPLDAPRVKFWHVLVKPSFGISTKEAYKSFSRMRKAGLTPPKANVKMLIRSLQEGQAEAVSRGLFNSLGVGAQFIAPIQRALLGQGALGALLSGSGSAVFGIFTSRKEAVRAARSLKKKKNWQVFVVSTF